MQCANNLKQIAIAAQNYGDIQSRERSHSPSKCALPAGTVPLAGLSAEQRLSWVVEILPFLEQDALARGFTRTQGWNAPANAPAGQTRLRVLCCPDWGREKEPDPPYLTAYLGVAGVGADAATLPSGDRNAGVFGYDRRTLLTEITDGTSNTFLVLESARDNGPWARGGPATVRGLVPGDEPYLGVGRQFGGTHFGENSIFGKGKSLGCSAAMADGSVRFLSEAMSSHVLEAGATMAGGENVSADW